MENEKQLLDAIKTQTLEVIESKMAGVASTEQIEGMKSMVSEKASLTEIQAIKDTVETLALEIKAAKEGSKNVSANLASSIKDNRPMLEKLSKKEREKISMSIKAFSTTTIGGTWTNFLEPQFIDGIVKTPDTKAQFNVLNYVTVGQAFSEIIKWIEEDTETGTALFIDECVSKPDVSKTWKRNEAAVKKVAAYTQVCDEVLKYLDWAEQEISLFLTKVVYKAIQEQIINGNGVGQNLNGMTNQASAFVAGSLAASVPFANEADAIAAMATQVNCLGFTANYAFMNCTDIFKLKQGLKATDGQYLNALTGVTIVDCPYIAAGSVLVGDFSVSNVRFFEDINVEMGLNGEDFRLNAISMRGEAYLAHYIPSNGVNGLIYDTFANVIALIDKP